MMRYGVCIGGDIPRIRLAKQSGFDYVESGFGVLVSDPEEKQNEFIAALRRENIPCESVNCFLPGNLKVVGPEVNEDALYAYVKKGMEAGERFGVKTVVFGSGGARRIPDGFPYNEAIRQIGSFLSQIAGPLAAEHGMTVVIEPLCDCNVIKTVKEGAVIASFVNHPNVRLLVDLYHMIPMGDTLDDLKQMRGLLKHSHIAEPSRRVYPTFEDGYDYGSFVRVLDAVGCERCSLEAGCGDFERESAVAMQVFRSL